MFDPKTKILVVDDMLTMRKVVAKFLKELGYTDISEASDGDVAWEKISCSDEPFGLILSDWNMPNCTGIDLLKRVRGAGKNQSVPFIMITAEGEQHQVQEASSFNVDAYVLKPFAKDKLAQVLGEVSQRKRTAA